MLFAADIGNSSIDLGVFDDTGALIIKSKISAVKTQCADEYAVMIHSILSLNHCPISAIRSSIISSVVPPLTAVLSDALHKLFGVCTMVVGPGVKTGINIKVDQPTQLGADIVSNAAAATAMQTGPLIVMDIGTATTISVIDDQNSLCGVIITPGIRLSLNALAMHASELPDVSISVPKRIIAKNTRDSMNSGVVYGHALMMDGFIDRIREELSAPEAAVIATGGLAGTVLPFCKHSIQLVENLTLRGLWIIHQKSKK